MNGDVPLVEPELLRELLEERRLDQAAVALIAVDAMDPGNLGRVVRDEAGIVDRIVEHKDATEDELAVTEINSGLYAFDATWLRARIGSLKASPKTGELYLTELVELAREDGRVVVALTVDDDGRLLGINDRAELAQAEWDMRTRINAAHMINGVTMRDPSTVYADATVTLAADVTIEPNVILRGSTSVGEDRHRGGEPRSSTARSAPAASSGRASWRRPRSRTLRASARSAISGPVPSSARTPRWATSPSSRTRRSARASSSTTSATRATPTSGGTNVGAGTITANFDGTSKHRTTVGERVFLGVDTMLRAPVTLGDDAVTGAGAVVTKDVPAGKLAVGVPARIREPWPKPPPDDGTG